MRRHFRLRGACAALILACLPRFEARADMDAFAGTYVLDAEASEDIASAFEPALREMNVVTRAIARRRLRDGVEPDATIRIEVENGAVEIQSGSRPSVTALANGEEADMERLGGLTKVSARLVEGVLRLDLTGERGAIRSDHLLCPDRDTLTVTTTLRFDRIPLPVTYRLVYRRR